MKNADKLMIKPGKVMLKSEIKYIIIPVLMVFSTLLLAETKKVEKTTTPVAPVVAVTPVFELPALTVVVSFDKEKMVMGEAVKLNYSVQNRSDKVQSFKLFNLPYTTVQPRVYDRKGREAELIVKHKQKKESTIKAVTGLQSRLVELDPGESYSIIINLADIYKLNPDQDYLVKGYLFPFAADNEMNIAGSNVEIFKISSAPAPIQEGEDIVQSRSITPGEIINLWFIAEKNRNWNVYIKYIDLEKYVEAFPQYSQQYLRAKGDPYRQQKVINEFRDYLRQNRNDYLMEYEILNETGLDNRHEAVVDVSVKRFGPARPIVYYYKYTLERYNDFWVITNVEATVGRN